VVDSEKSASKISARTDLCFTVCTVCTTIPCLNITQLDFDDNIFVIVPTILVL
jgi:hypothetical protein